MMTGSQPAEQPVLESIVSGGQTGVDRAALDVALEFGLPCGGWCPLGRRAEDGPIPVEYPLRETPKEKYQQRTRWNVRDSDGTLILTIGSPQGGTELTRKVAERLEKPHLVLDLAETADTRAVADWVSKHRIHVLNVAGPRESTQPGIYEQAAKFLRSWLADLPNR